MPERKARWVGATREFVVVVLGILVALALDDLNEARKERGLERDYLMEIAEDLAADSAELDVNRSAAVARARASRRLLVDAGVREGDLFSMPTEGPGSFEGPASGCEQAPLGCIGVYRVFDGSRGTYDELLGSGNLRVLRDRGLARALSHYYAVAASERDADVALVRWSHEGFWGALQESGVAMTGPAAPDELALLLKRDVSLVAKLRDLAFLAVWQVRRIDEGHRPALDSALKAVRGVER